jgi:hypothetical protein
MKRRNQSYLVPVLLTATLSTMGLIAPLSYGADDWEARYKELCKYDGMCGKLKASYGSSEWTSPKADIVDVLRTSKPLILAAAKLYGVDPRAIAGCILTENSLNLQMKHQAELWVAKFMKGSDHSIFGKRFGTGLGQLHDDIAYDVEPRAAAMEKRPQLKTMEQVHERMETLEGSIYYVAAILKDAQDVYRKYGFDITKDIGLQTTLYNLGEYDRRAKDTKANNRTPRINHFGFFVLHNEPLLASVVGMNSGAPSMAVLAGSASANANASANADTAAATNASGSSRANQISSSKSKGKAIVLTEPVDVANLPDLCDQSAAKKNIAKLPKNIPYQVIAQDVDCKLNKWSLVAGADGTVGWVKHSTLESKSTQTADFDTCQAKADTGCARSLAASTKGKSGIRSEKGGTFAFELKKVTNCNAANDMDSIPADYPVFEDALSDADFTKLTTVARLWNQAAEGLKNNKNASALKTISDALEAIGPSGSSIVNSGNWNGNFLIKKSNYDKLLDFFGKTPTEALTDKQASEIVATLKSTALLSKRQYGQGKSAVQVCPNIPDTYPQTARYVRNFIVQLAQATDDYNSSKSFYNGYQSLSNFCKNELVKPTETTPAPLPSASSLTKASAAKVTPGACEAPTDAHHGKLTKMMKEYQNACAQLLKSDQELLAKAKASLKITETLAEVRDCGYDFDEAAQRLGKVKASGCAKEIFVDSAPAFEFMATQKIDTIYKPSSTDGRFTITPKQNISCSEKGAAK